MLLDSPVAGLAVFDLVWVDEAGLAVVFLVSPDVEGLAAAPLFSPDDEGCAVFPDRVCEEDLVELLLFCSVEAGLAFVLLV